MQPEFNRPEFLEGNSAEENSRANDEQPAGRHRRYAGWFSV